MPKLLKTDWMLCMGFYLLSALSGSVLLMLCSCAGGPKVKLCAVDAPAEAFECAKKGEKDSVIPFAELIDLKCARPFDFEEALKACKNHKILPIDLCTLQVHNKSFVCTSASNGAIYTLTYEQANNFICASDQDRRRLQERCQ